MERAVRRTRMLVIMAIAAGLAVPAWVAQAAPTPSTRAPATWEPGPARYGTKTTEHVRITMSDGAVLQADVTVPVDQETGEAAPGPFPVILVQTPYGRSGNVEPYFIERGYIWAVVDVRGRGSSEGIFDPFGPQSVRDGVELVDWASHLPNSTGEVGTWGGSFLGIDQLMTAGAVGANSPLKATFPLVASNSNYRDLTLGGGVYNGGFTTPYTLASGVGDGMSQPVTQSDGDAPRTARVLAQHATFAFDPTVATQVQINTQTGAAYDDQWWRARSVAPLLDDIVANDVPTMLVGGWYDLFQRGETVNYVGLQNAFAGRPVDAPMLPGQKTSPKYQLVMGPWFHSVSGGGQTPELDLHALALKWFDTWLKDADTGLDRSKTPLHLYENKSDRWVSTTVWPPAPATATTLYFGAGPASSGSPSVNDGVLTAAAPTSTTAGADTLVFTQVASPCHKQTSLQLAGAPNAVPGIETCTNDARTTEAGPGALTYSTAPLDRDVDLAGPMAVTVHLTSTRPEALLYVALEDVAPDGTADVVTYGQQVASMRALDTGRSWFRDGALIAPYHHFTSETATPVASGETVTVDVELYGTLTRIAAGHSLRLVVASSASHLSPGAQMLANLAGGVYQLQRTPAAPSHVNVMALDPVTLTGVCAIC